MTLFKGFETKKEANEYVKKNGGVVWTRTRDKYSPYEECVHLGGLNPDKYPFVVIKRWCVMKIKETITLDDVLDFIGINYEGVKETVIEYANESNSEREFFNKFEEYYSEHGLGGDDTWMDTKLYLSMFLNY